MLVFIVIAIADLFIGVFIHEFFNPEERKKMILFKYGLDPLKYGANLDAVFFDLDKDLNAIKKGNRIILYFCMLVAAVTLINGLLVKKFNFIDIKDTLLIITLITIFPLRYFYIFLKTR